MSRKRWPIRCSPATRARPSGNQRAATGTPGVAHALGCADRAYRAQAARIETMDGRSTPAAATAGGCPWEERARLVSSYRDNYVGERTSGRGAGSGRRDAGRSHRTLLGDRHGIAIEPARAGRCAGSNPATRTRESARFRWDALHRWWTIRPRRN